MTSAILERTDREAGRSPRILVVDYHKGNIRSVERALALCGADALVSDSPRDVERCDAVVLPGVGAFTDAMATLDELRLSCALRGAIDDGKPFLGICLGLHLLFEAGEEHASEGLPTCGLGVFPGVVGRMPDADAKGCAYKVPHVGWNRVNIIDEEAKRTIFSGVEDGSFLYFTHSYIAPTCESVIATSTHSVEFPCAVAKDNVYGVQFHPEKSSDIGLAIVQNFVNISRSIMA